ncbi:MAG: AAA family ATPase [Eubacterium sp.]|nr:AAA family ATPase [Eubacterium sp.]
MTERNIPEISTDEIIHTLSDYYTAAVSGGTSLKKLFTAFLWGPPGVGKSDAVREIAEAVRLQTGKKSVVTEVRLLLFSPIDLRGVPVPDKAHEFTNWLRPRIFDLDPSDDVVNFLFLDELTAAAPAVQAAAYQVTLDRRIGEHELPDNCIVIGAGNRVTDNSVSFHMPAALANRMKHFDIGVSFAGWRRWAVSHEINPYVLGYLSYDNTRLFSEDRIATDAAFPTPRSWEAVSRDLNIMGKAPWEIHTLISASIGTDSAIEFEAWAKIFQSLPAMADIFRGKTVTLPRKPDVLYAMISAMTGYITENREKLSIEELGHGIRFAGRFPADYGALFYRNLQDIPGLSGKLVRTPGFHEWTERIRAYM